MKMCKVCGFIVEKAEDVQKFKRCPSCLKNPDWKTIGEDHPRYIYSQTTKNYDEKREQRFHLMGGLK
jgi:hypothetical protein